LGKKTLALDTAHRSQDGGVSHALGAKLAFDHGFASRGKIRNWGLDGHDCYMPLIHLEFEHVLSTAPGGRGAVHIGRDPSRQPPLIERWAAIPRCSMQLASCDHRG